MTRRKEIREDTTPGRTLTDSDIAAVGKVFKRAVKAAAKEARKRSRSVGETIIPAPAPKTPSGNQGDSGDAFADRTNQLLGSFAKTAPISYSLSDLASDAQAMNTVFSGRAYTG